MRKLSMAERAFMYRVKVAGNYCDGELKTIVESCIEFSKISIVSVVSLLQITYIQLATKVWSPESVLNDFEIVKNHINNSISMNTLGQL